MQPSPATCTAQCPCRRTRFRSTRGPPKSGSTYRVLPITACRVYLRDGTGHITSYEKHTLANEFPEYEIRAYLQQRNGWTAHTLDSINWTAYRAAISALTDQVRTFDIITGYQLAFGNADTALRLPPARNAFNPKQYSRTNRRDQSIDNLTKHLKDASTAADLRCTIVEGIQKWFWTDDTNEPDEPDPTTQLGLYQVIKGYLPNQWSMKQATFFRDQGLDDSRYNSGERWTRQLIAFFWT
jgi:Holliday junction resolvase RusA-like endonuclease